MPKTRNLPSSSPLHPPLSNPLPRRQNSFFFSRERFFHLALFLLGTFLLSFAADFRVVEVFASFFFPSPPIRTCSSVAQRVTCLPPLSFHHSFIPTSFFLALSVYSLGLDFFCLLRLNFYPPLFIVPIRSSPCGARLCGHDFFLPPPSRRAACPHPSIPPFWFTTLNGPSVCCFDLLPLPPRERWHFFH